MPPMLGYPKTLTPTHKRSSPEARVDPVLGRVAMPDDLPFYGWNSGPSIPGSWFRV